LLAIKALAGAASQLLLFSLYPAWLLPDNKIGFLYI
jgi:hypothetical protein